MYDDERQRNIFKLTEAIDEDSKAIAGLLQACGQSKAFALEQATLFEKFITHRQQLLILLAALRGRVRHTDELEITCVEQ
jgi:hypothetical protein